MNRPVRLLLAGLVAGVLVTAVRPGHAHKAITSPFMFAEDVMPILREHCSACHVSGGVAPMSLMAYEETVPWAESIRVELIAGHMPPWGVESAASRILNARPLTARELNVLLTWAAGGTPQGTAATTGAPEIRQQAWRLGEPDLVLQPPRDFTMPADVQERIEEFTLEPGTTEARWLRAVDVRPGDPTVVRRASVSLAPGQRQATSAETLLALWVPGDDPVPAENAAFLLPAGARLVLRVHYRKTWQRERDVVSDRSAVGLYFAREALPELRAITLEPAPGDIPASGPGAVAFTRMLPDDLRAVAIYPDPTLHGVTVDVKATRPDGSTDTLIVFRPQANWARRYWFRQPIGLPAGTRIDVRATHEDESALVPPGAIRRAQAAPTSVRLTLNVIAAR